MPSLPSWSCIRILTSKHHNRRDGVAICHPTFLQMCIRDRINFVRYADDFIVTGKSPETLRNEVIPLIKDFLEMCIRDRVYPAE